MPESVLAVGRGGLPRLSLGSLPFNALPIQLGHVDPGDAAPQFAVNLGSRPVRVVLPDGAAGQVVRQASPAESTLDALRGRHAPEDLDLELPGSSLMGRRIHAFIIAGSTPRHDRARMETAAGARPAAVTNTPPGSR